MSTKFLNGDKAKFLKIKGKFKAALQAAIEKTIVDMGQDAKGISWFSSSAGSYAKKLDKKAA